MGQPPGLWGPQKESATMGPLLGHEQKPGMTLVTGAQQEVLLTWPLLTTGLCTSPEKPKKGLCCCKGQRMPTGKGARSYFVCAGCLGS